MKCELHGLLSTSLILRLLLFKTTNHIIEWGHYIASEEPNNERESHTISWHVYIYLFVSKLGDVVPNVLYSLLVTRKKVDTETREYYTVATTTADIYIYIYIYIYIWPMR